EVLNLPRPHSVPLQVEGELDWVLERGARMPGDEVGDQGLLFACPFACLAESLRESLVGLDAWLLHLVEHPRVVVLGSDGELAAGVMQSELANKVGTAIGKIVPNTRCDEDALDALLAPHGAHQRE